MTDVTVALLQMASFGYDQEANLRKGETFCRQAREMGADIALFPEMWNIGYSLPPTDDLAARQAWQLQAIGAEGPFVTHFQELAQELHMAIALTYLQKWEGAPRNVVSLLDRHGALRLTYAKVHTCDFDTEIALTPGDDFYVCALDTAAGPVKVGAMICFDREFPESARILMLQGAELILTPNACELEQNRLAQFRTRACENMVGVAMANYAAPQEKGHSVAYDGIAFDEHEGSRDMCLVEAGADEGVYLARFDLDRLRAYRSSEAWGNAYRKPRCYGLLTSEVVEPPFMRADARR
jgi:N-carbamoylputrescine amidase